MSEASTDGSANGSIATAGDMSGSRQDGNFASSAAATTQETNTQSSSGNSSLRGGIFQFGVWLSLLFLLLMLLPLVIWVVVKAVRKHEASQNQEVVYQNLQDARQVYYKIMKS